MKYLFTGGFLAHFSFMLSLIRQRFFQFLLFSVFSFIFLSQKIPFRKLREAAIKSYSAKYKFFQFDKLYKIMESRDIRQYPGHLSTWSQCFC